MGCDYGTYDNSELANLLSKGSEAALKEIMRRYWECLYSRINNFLRSGDTAKDCVQDIFISLWQNREKAQIENLDHYLHQAARFRAFEVIRRHKTDSALQTRINRYAQHILESDLLEFKELKATLRRLISSLPDDQRLIFMLHREEGLTYNQISEQLGISVKTVEKKMSKSLAYLRMGMGIDKATRFAIIFSLLAIA